MALLPEDREVTGKEEEALLASPTGSGQGREPVSSQAFQVLQKPTAM